MTADANGFSITSKWIEEHPRLFAYAAIVAPSFLLGYFFIPTYRDNAFFHLPIFDSLGALRKSPSFLLPQLNAGEPAAVDPRTLSFYPTSFLVYVLDPSWVYAVHFFLHFSLSLYEKCQNAPLLAVGMNGKNWHFS
jgi:hypothetical protein